ncbi:hypothetical protein MHYP_G00240630 [Metynnis hypsauchen]
MEDASERLVEEEKRLFKLIASRRGKLGVLTRKRNEINALFESGEEKEAIAKHVEQFCTYLAEFAALHESVRSLLGADEREADHGDWYEPKMTHFNEFLNAVQSRMDVSKEDIDHTAMIDAGAAASGVHEQHEADIRPEDSVSQASTKGSNDSSSKSSKALSATSAYLKLEAERAALLAKQQALEQKHTLDLEEAQLKAKKEKLALEVELAAANAKTECNLKICNLSTKQNRKALMCQYHLLRMLNLPIHFIMKHLQTS